MTGSSRQNIQHCIWYHHRLMNYIFETKCFYQFYLNETKWKKYIKHWRKVGTVPVLFIYNDHCITLIRKFTYIKEWNWFPKARYRRQMRCADATIASFPQQTVNQTAEALFSSTKLTSYSEKRRKCYLNQKRAWSLYYDIKNCNKNNLQSQVLIEFILQNIY